MAHHTKLPTSAFQYEHMLAHCLWRQKHCQRVQSSWRRPAHRMILEYPTQERAATDYKVTPAIEGASNSSYNPEAYRTAYSSATAEHFHTRRYSSTVIQHEVAQLSNLLNTQSFLWPQSARNCRFRCVAKGIHDGLENKINLQTHFQYAEYNPNNSCNFANLP